ncbi:hypothetical protein E3N88_29139 [Mikania micrantha]|uniref:Uncharacterized protein n=1 Tax=Mikania micrantha TaxID=192012 RepID=A0A5N6N1T6_9ASTR|nr:hypothetical protein E3N88_29139 [Mikania micrantha]
MSLHKKSLSDGNINIHGSKSPATTSLSSSSLSCSLHMGKNFACSSMLDGSLPGGSKMISESTPEISASCEAFSRYTPPSIPSRGVFEELRKDDKESDSFDYSNFVDLDWLSFSCGKESLGRCWLTGVIVVAIYVNHLIFYFFLDQFSNTPRNETNEILAETTLSTSEAREGGGRVGASLMRNIQIVFCAGLTMERLYATDAFFLIRSGDSGLG